MTTTSLGPGAELPAELVGYVGGLMARLVGFREESDRSYLVASRLGGLAREHGFANVAAFLAAAARERASATEVAIAEAMVVHETSFFREREYLEILSRRVIPQLVARRPHLPILSMWSAACATGQEPYSLAMMSDELPALQGWKVVLLATDFSRQALARAQAGQYSQLEVNRGLPARLLTKYFQRQGIHWVANDHLRQAVQYEQLNLAAPWPHLAAMDIVLLRNALLYIDDGARAAILGRMRRVLRPDGYLLLGATESISAATPGWKRVMVEGVSFYQRDDEAMDP